MSFGSVIVLVNILYCIIKLIVLYIFEFKIEGDKIILLKKNL